MTLEEQANNDFLIWLLEYWYISSGEYAGEQYSFEKRPYLIDICKDNFQNKATMKPAQIGLSEIEVARALWHVTRKRNNVLYTFPAGEQMQEFVDSRARQAVLQSPYLASKVTGSLNLKKFSISGNQIYFRGVTKRRQIISVDVSILIADEIDEYEEGTLTTLEKRLGASANPIIEYFSTPTFHGVGISLYYFGSDSLHEKGSDQRVYGLKCEHCSKWNEGLDWFKNTLDLNEDNRKSQDYYPNIIVICSFCKKEINRFAVGEWIVRFPSLSDYRHGYYPSKLLSPVANLNKIQFDLLNPVKEQETYNSELGLPFEPKGARLDDATIDNARGVHVSYMNCKEKTFAGVDVGNQLHYLIGTYDENNKIKILRADTSENWEELDSVFDKFNARASVIDANPDKDEAINFQANHGNVWLAYYNRHLENTTEHFTVDYDTEIVQIHRTLMMMLASDMIVNHDIALPMDIAKVRDFYEHLKAPIKALKQDLIGNWIPFYPKINKNDHYYHALVYLITASQLKKHPVKSKIVKIF